MDEQKPSINYHGTQDAARNDLKHRLTALNYPLGSVKNSSHVKSSAAFSEQTNHSSSSQSKREKERIPNVLAKLMGRDEFPENVDSKHTIQKDSIFLEKSVQRSTKKAQKRTKNAENLTQLTSKQKMIKTKIIPGVQNNVASQAETELAAGNAGFQVEFHDGKLPWKDFEGTKPVTGNVISLSHNIGRQKDNQKRERVLTGAEKGKMKGPLLKDELQRMPPWL